MSKPENRSLLSDKNLSIDPGATEAPNTESSTISSKVIDLPPLVFGLEVIPEEGREDSLPLLEWVLEILEGRQGVEVPASLPLPEMIPSKDRINFIVDWKPRAANIGAAPLPHSALKVIAAPKSCQASAMMVKFSDCAEQAEFKIWQKDVWPPWINPRAHYQTLEAKIAAIEKDKELAKLLDALQIYLEDKYQEASLNTWDDDLQPWTPQQALRWAKIIFASIHKSDFEWLYPKEMKELRSVLYQELRIDLSSAKAALDLAESFCLKRSFPAALEPYMQRNKITSLLTDFLIQRLGGEEADYLEFHEFAKLLIKKDIAPQGVNDYIIWRSKFEKLFDHFSWKINLSQDSEILQRCFDDINQIMQDLEIPIRCQSIINLQDIRELYSIVEVEHRPLREVLPKTILASAGHSRCLDLLMQLELEEAAEVEDKHQADLLTDLQAIEAEKIPAIDRDLRALSDPELQDPPDPPDPPDPLDPPDDIGLLGL